MAKSYLSDYSPTPASNTDIDGVDSTGATGRVKDGDNYTRSVMSHLAKFYDDLGAVNTVGGTATAITVTAAEGWTAYGSSANQIDTGTILAIKTGSAATGAATLNVNGIGAKAIRRQGDTAIQADDWMANAILMLRYDAAYDGAAGAWVLLDAPALVPRVVRTQVFTASGTYTPHANMISCILECVGGGGAGGGATASVGNAFGGGGGGGGAYSRTHATRAQIGVSQTVTNGAGGTGVSGANGGAGGTTSVGTLCTAPGGGGGLVGSALNGSGGGTGGAKGTGDFTGMGSPGTTGQYSQTALPVMYGGGGSSIMGGGRQSDVTSGTTPGSAANANTGGGGSGGGVVNTAASVAGGNGGSGFVFITEFCSA